jgi:hypothetical protein
MRSSPRAPASCGAAVEQGGGDGDAPWRWVIDEVAELSSGGGVRRWQTTDSGGHGLNCQLVGRGKRVSRVPSDDEMPERVELTE